MSSNPSTDSWVEQTIAFYNQNAEHYYRHTIDLDVSHLYAPFLELLPAGAHVLDAGCGSGRDSLFFLQKGFRVTAFDASAAMVHLASRLTGLPVVQCTFAEIDFPPEFDAIWACASLLHIARAEMDQAISRLSRLLKPGGILFASFKSGSAEVFRHGRLFNDYDEASFQTLLTRHPDLKRLKLWTNTDVLPDQTETTWLNTLMQKNNSAPAGG